MAAAEEAKVPGPPSDADKARARQWFKKAEECRDQRNYDYAIECYIKGLEFWPEAVEEGHMPLRATAVQRAQAGGKKPGMMDGMKYSMGGKDARQAFFNAEHLFAWDPLKGDYLDGMLRNATRAALIETARWVAPLVLENLRREAKPNKSRFKSFREALVEAAEKAESAGRAEAQVFFLEQAVQSLDLLVGKFPTEEDLRQEQRNLSGKLTIARGKYQSADNFRESLQDADKQKLLHDQERVKQGEHTLTALVTAARADYDASRDNANKINAYVDALLKPERDAEDEQAVAVLLDAYERLNNYSFKMRADDVRIRVLSRQVRRLTAHARETGSPDDKQQARLAALEQRELVLEVFRERVAKYPTDLRLKVRLGIALFEVGSYDEAIPVLQAAQAEPRHRVRSQLLLGRAFFEKGNPAQAVEILRETIDSYELTDDTSRELLYWLARAYQSAGRLDEAKNTYGKLLRQDYNYAEGDARRRLEELNQPAA